MNSAGVKAIAISVMVVILALILALNFIGGTYSEVLLSADSAQYGNSNCSDVSDANGVDLYFDASISTTRCTNSSGVASNYTADLNQLPFSSFFDRSGLILIGLMIGIFIVILGIAGKKFLKK